MISKLLSRSIPAIFISTLVCGVTLIAGCQKKADPAALEKVDKAVASYQKIVNSYSASGFSAEEFRTQSNDADFLLMDAIKFLQAKGISESFLGGEKLSDIAARWADYRNIFNAANEFDVKWRKRYSGLDVSDACYETRTQHYITNPFCHQQDNGWLVNTVSELARKTQASWGETVLDDPVAARGMIQLAKKLPELSLEDYLGQPLPESVMKEIRDYHYGVDEPKDFLMHFEKYCQQSKFGFDHKKEQITLNNGDIDYPHYEWCIHANLTRVKSAAISQLGKEAEQLDMKIKKIQ